MFLFVNQQGLAWLEFQHLQTELDGRSDFIFDPKYEEYLSREYDVQFSKTSERAVVFSVTSNQVFVARTIDYIQDPTMIVDRYLFQRRAVALVMILVFIA